VTIAADPDRVWQLAVDWSRQQDWIWATRTTGGQGLGATVTARTGAGPLGFTDPMLITEWDPPRRCAVTHTGSIVRGKGVFEVLPRDGGSEFRWTEWIVLPEPRGGPVPPVVLAGLTRIAYALIAPIARAGLGSSLIRFARLAEAVTQNAGPS
jgi:Polyketide cyclase / dehydrase and lipid transport